MARQRNIRSARMAGAPRIEGGFVSIPVEETGEEICLEVR